MLPQSFVFVCLILILKMVYFPNSEFTRKVKRKEEQQKRNGDSLLDNPLGNVSSHSLLWFGSKDSTTALFLLESFILYISDCTRMMSCPGVEEHELLYKNQRSVAFQPFVFIYVLYFNRIEAYCLPQLFIFLNLFFSKR